MYLISIQSWKNSSQQMYANSKLVKNKDMSQGLYIGLNGRKIG